MTGAAASTGAELSTENEASTRIPWAVGFIVGLSTLATLLYVFVAPTSGWLSTGGDPYLKTGAFWVLVGMWLFQALLMAFRSTHAARLIGTAFWLFVIGVSLWIGHSNKAWAYHNVTSGLLESFGSWSYGLVLAVPVVYFWWTWLVVYHDGRKTAAWLRWLILPAIIGLGMLFSMGFSQCSASTLVMAC